MELLVTIAYLFLIWLVFFNWRWLKFNAAWGLLFAGIWCGAALTEIIMLGQYTPYTKELVVTSYVLQIAPEFGGIVEEVPAEPNVPIKKGDVLFVMDRKPWQDQVDELEPQVATARRNYDDAKALVRAKVEREVKLVEMLDQLNALKAKLADAQYKLDHATVVAPANGYVIDMQLQPGVFIRLKQPVMTFVDTDSLTIIGVIPQVASQWVKPGDPAEIALEMYPGMVLKAKVDEVLFGSGGAQFTPSGLLPALQTLHIPKQFVVRLRLDGDYPDHPLRFSASGLGSIYTSKAADAFVFLRRLEIQSESFLNYVYNPF